MGQGLPDLFSLIRADNFFLLQDFQQLLDGMAVGQGGLAHCQQETEKESRHNDVRF